MSEISKFVDINGCWIYQGNPIEGLKLLAQTQCPCPILDLRSIPLTSLPQSIAQIQDLEALYLDQNGLNTLPDCIGDIQKLKVLSLGRNQITNLPQSLENCWATLQQLFLGHNQIEHFNLDEEWMTAFKQGSIGQNPITEPISPLWMMKQDVVEFPDRIQALIPFKGSKTLQKELLPLSIELLKGCCEPMIYESLFEGVFIEAHRQHQVLHQIHWNDFFQHPLLQLIGWEIVPFIPRGSILDPSLDKWKIVQYNFDVQQFQSLLWVPKWLRTQFEN